MLCLSSKEGLEVSALHLKNLICNFLFVFVASVVVVAAAELKPRGHIFVVFFL